MRGRYQTAYDSEGKAAFLKDAKELARAICLELDKNVDGLDVRIRTNRGGVAVSGEIYTDVCPKEGPRLHLTIEQSCIRGSGGRDDGVVLFAQKHEPRRQGSYAIVWGNKYLDIDMPPTWLATQLEYWMGW